MCWVIHRGWMDLQGVGTNFPGVLRAAEAHTAWEEGHRGRQDVQEAGSPCVPQGGQTEDGISQKEDAGGHTPK